MTDEITGYDAVEGYCGSLSYARGRAADDPRLVHRAELHGAHRAVGRAARARCGRRTAVDGIAHPLPDDADAHGCGWPAAVELDVPAEWRSGFYVVTLHAPTARRPTGRRATPASSCAPGADALAEPAGDRDQHVQRVQRVGRAQPVHRRQGGLVPPAVRAGDDRPPRRPSATTARPGRGTAARSPTSTARSTRRYRFANGLPGFMGSAGWFTYERRFVEWAEAEGVELDYAISADLEQHPDVVDGYDLVLGVGHDEYWSARSARHGRGPRPRRRHVRQHVGQHDLLAGPPGRRWRHDGLPQVLGARHRPGRRHRPGGDHRHVVRPGGRPPGVGVPRGQLGVRPVQPVRSGDATRLGRVHRLPRRPLAARRHRPALRRPARRRSRRRRLRDGRLPPRASTTCSCRCAPAATTRPRTWRSSRSPRRPTWRWASTRSRSPRSTTRATWSSSPPACTAASTPTSLARVRHGNAVMVVARPFGAAGRRGDHHRQHRLGATASTRRPIRPSPR